MFFIGFSSAFVFFKNTGNMNPMGGNMGPVMFMQNGGKFCFYDLMSNWFEWKLKKSKLLLLYIIFLSFKLDVKSSTGMMGSPGGNMMGSSAGDQQVNFNVHTNLHITIIVDFEIRIKILFQK